MGKAVAGTGASAGGAGASGGGASHTCCRRLLDGPLAGRAWQPEHHPCPPCCHCQIAHPPCCRAA
eukprot:322837-Chlamydomonas_euryale.AAC.1